MPIYQRNGHHSILNWRIGSHQHALLLNISIVVQTPKIFHPSPNRKPNSTINTSEPFNRSQAPQNQSPNAYSRRETPIRTIWHSSVRIRQNPTELTPKIRRRPQEQGRCLRCLIKTAYVPREIVVEKEKERTWPRRSKANGERDEALPKAASPSKWGKNRGPPNL